MLLKHETAKALLNALGLKDVDLVGDDFDPADENLLTDVDSLIKQVDSNRIPVLKPSIESAVRASIRGQVGGALRSELVRATGITHKDLEGIEKDEEAIKKALEMALSTGSGDSNSKEQIAKLIEAHEAKVNDLSQQYNAQISDLQSKYNDKEVSEFISKMLSEFEIEDSVDKALAAKIVKNTLLESVDIKFNDAEGKINAFQKGSQNPAMNKSGTQLFDWKEATESVLKPLGMIKEKRVAKDPQVHMRNVNPPAQSAAPSIYQSTPAGTLNDAIRAKLAIE